MGTENRRAVVTQEMDFSHLEEHILMRLDKALNDHEIKVYYQPVVRTLSEKLCGMEALARWEDPEYGLLPPDRFVHVLEKHKLIHLLDLYIICEVCERYSRCRQQGILPVPVSVNLSRLDFEAVDVLQEVERIVGEYEVPKEVIRFEITESVLTEHADEMQKWIRELQEAGYEVWMDDFGSGYSSLNVLKDYAFNELKIDMRFLSDFSARSREIIASIVDMAKRIGIHTLAEGVENREQKDFLLSIGCEKIQGYYYGPPLPYEQCLLELKDKGIDRESPAEQQYYDEIGKVNVLSANPFDFHEEAKGSEFLRSSDLALALIEFDADAQGFRTIYINDACKKALKLLGYSEPQDVVDAIKARSFPAAGRFIKALDRTRTQGSEIFNYVDGGDYCSVKLKLISSSGSRSAILYSLTDISRNTDMERDRKLDGSLRHLYAIYNEVYLLHIDKGYLEVLTTDNQEAGERQHGSIKDIVTRYAAEKVYDEDRPHYLKFFDTDTMEEKIRESQKGFINAYIRTIDGHGNYSWKIYLAFIVKPEHVLVMVRDEDTAKGNVWNHYRKDYFMEEEKEGYSEDISPEILWQNALRWTELGIFWKDRERRFMGVNRKFLDYYGFHSVEEVIGKTDEDMGWHVSPDAFREDEINVLNKGISTHEVPGHCLVNGQNKSIVASKTPIYKDGRITGILGFFREVNNAERLKSAHPDLQEIDHLTGLLNVRGGMNILLEYQDEYMLHKQDFCMISISIDNFRELQRLYGSAFCDQVLFFIAELLRKRFGTECALLRHCGDEFRVIRQVESREEAEKLEKAVYREVAGIHMIRNKRFTLYPSTGLALYSEQPVAGQMLRTARERMQANRRRHIARFRKNHPEY
ncbi:MAG: EAL domain-containing protein [Oribacterium sp.]|nr:EAL domain-containing protein [Oribacterium sp.]